MSGPSLKFFSEAKNSVTEIVSKLIDVLQRSEKIVDSYQQQYEIFDAKESNNFKEFTEKLNLINEIFKRNSMKVAFFGRTSNGKSTVINAMLRDKILPSGIGHTTNCFVQVEGTDSSEVYIMMEDGSKKNVQSLGQLASALSKVRLSSDNLLRIVWPKDLCPLLQDDVIFVDSPGIDLSADVDKWIDKFCLDADVFVLVANAESTLMQTEKNFFHQVSNRISKPNIFILNNRWDASVFEKETMAQVKQQHLERCSTFLVNELQVMPSSDIEKRIFFVSALEMLEQHINLSRPSLVSREGLQERLEEFMLFEDCFKECISKSAVQTKFGHHINNLCEVTDHLTRTIESALCRITQIKSESMSRHIELNQSLGHIIQSYEESTTRMEFLIRQSSEELKHKLLLTMRKEMRHLEGIIDEYDRLFNPDDLEVMRLYRKDLSFHVEECISRNLHIKFTPMAKSILVTAGNNMTECVKVFLPESKYELLDEYIKPMLEFEVIYNLNCSGLCSDFLEDLEFHFSLGLTAVLNKYLGRNYMTDEELTDALLINTTTSSSAKLPFASKTTIGVLAILSLVAKVVGSRFIFTCMSIYGIVYLYERVTWSMKAKEKAFKRQYISYIRDRLRSVMHILCSNCSLQIERELSSLRNEINSLVLSYKDELSKQLKKCERDAEAMDQLRVASLSIKESLNDLADQLDKFKTKFIS